MLGVNSHDSVPPQPDTSAGLKAMLGVGSSGPPTQAMGQGGYPMPPIPYPSMGMGGFYGPAPPQMHMPQANLSSAADKLLHMMQSAAVPHEIRPAPMPPHPSTFNFTYVEEGKDAPVPTPQQQMYHPSQPPMMMMAPMNMAGPKMMHTNAPPPPPRIDLPEDEFPALGAAAVTREGAPKQAAGLPKREPKPPQPMVPSIVMSKPKK